MRRDDSTYIQPCDCSVKYELIMLIIEAKPSTGMGSECQQDGMASAHPRLEHVIELAEDKTKNLTFDQKGERQNSRCLTGADNKNNK